MPPGEASIPTVVEVILIAAGPGVMGEKAEDPTTPKALEHSMLRGGEATKEEAGITKEEAGFMKGEAGMKEGAGMKEEAGMKEGAATMEETFEARAEAAT